MSNSSRPIVSRFLAAGAVNTIVSYLVFALLYAAIGTHVGYLAVLLLAYVINVTFAFLTQARFVFRQRGGYAPAFARFNLVTVGSLAANASLLHILVQLSLSPFVAQLIAVLLIALVTFVIHQNYTFRQDHVTNDQTPLS